MATAALLEDEREPQRREVLDELELRVVTDAHRSQTDIGDQRRDDAVGVTSGTGVEQVGLHAADQPARPGLRGTRRGDRLTAGADILCGAGLALAGHGQCRKAAPFPTRRSHLNL